MHRETTVLLWIVSEWHCCCLGWETQEHEGSNLCSRSCRFPARWRAHFELCCVPATHFSKSWNPPTSCFYFRRQRCEELTWLYLLVESLSRPLISSWWMLLYWHPSIVSFLSLKRTKIKSKKQEHWKSWNTVRLITSCCSMTLSISRALMCCFRPWSWKEVTYNTKYVDQVLRRFYFHFLKWREESTKKCYPVFHWFLYKVKTLPARVKLVLVRTFEV